MATLDARYMQLADQMRPMGQLRRVVHPVSALKVAERQAESTPMRIWWSIVFNGTHVSRAAHGGRE